MNFVKSGVLKSYRNALLNLTKAIINEYDSVKIKDISHNIGFDKIIKNI